MTRQNHEFLAPMNDIIDMLESLRNSLLDATQQGYVNAAFISAEKLLRLIDVNLDLSKGEIRELVLQTTDFDLHLLVEEIHALWKSQADRKHLQLLLDITSDVPRNVCGDPARIRQILGNLINNAIKFTHEGFVSITLDSMFISDDAPFMLRFSIQDTGIGISADLQKSLFLPSAHTEGDSVLGLSICKQLTDLMQGEITVDSAPEVGSCFTVVLPFTHGQTASKPTPALATAINDQHHILVVDDNDINIKVAVSMLERLGYTTHTAIDGLEAVSAVQHHEFDLILMDCHMPVMDGIDATRSIRARERSCNRSAIPIIAVSASAFAEDRQRCAEAGMNDFLPKPITLNSLRSMLEKWHPQLASAADVAPLTTADIMSPALPAQLFSHAQFIETRNLAGVNFGRILQAFITDTQQQVDNMNSALTTASAEALRRSAHKLKGSSSSLGARQLAALCGSLENHARTQCLDNAAEEVAAIAQCWRATELALQPFLAAV